MAAPSPSATTTIGKYIARFRHETPRPRDARQDVRREDFWWVQSRRETDACSPRGGGERPSGDAAEHAAAPDRDATVMDWEVELLSEASSSVAASEIHEGARRSASEMDELSSSQSWSLPSLRDSSESPFKRQPHPAQAFATTDSGECPVARDALQADEPLVDDGFVVVVPAEKAPPAPLSGDGEHEMMEASLEDPEVVIQRIRRRLGFQPHASFLSSALFSPAGGGGDSRAGTQSVDTLEAEPFSRSGDYASALSPLPCPPLDSPLPSLDVRAHYSREPSPNRPGTARDQQSAQATENEARDPVTQTEQSPSVSASREMKEEDSFHDAEGETKAEEEFTLEPVGNAEQHDDIAPADSVPSPPEPVAPAPAPPDTHEPVETDRPPVDGDDAEQKQEDAASDAGASVDETAATAVQPKPPAPAEEEPRGSGRRSPQLPPLSPARGPVFKSGPPTPRALDMGETKITPETSKTLDTLLSFVVQSWGDNSLFSGSDDGDVSTNGDAASQHERSATSCGQRTPVEVEDISEGDVQEATSGQCEDVDESVGLHHDGDDDDDDGAFDDDPIVQMLRQRIGVFEEALERLETTQDTAAT